MGLGGKDVISEEYHCTLSEPLREIALKELREDDYTREQSLDNMREWIRKNQQIKRCRTDAPFLLRFLRTKKFSVPLACEMLERYLIIRQLYPEWFRNLDCQENDLAELINSGYVVPLLEKHEGKTVIFICAEKFDPHKYTAAHMIRISSLLAEVLMDDEENQVNGYVYVNDLSGFQMAHISLWSLKDIRNVLRCIQNSSPMRHKENYLVNVSSGASKLLDIGLTILSEKLRNRIFIHTSIDDLETKIDKKILPKEFGGDVSLKDMIEQFKIKLQNSRSKVLALDELYIEIDENNCKFLAELNEELGVGIEGSFKKLQVD